jgi:phospholipase C
LTVSTFQRPNLAIAISHSPSAIRDLPFLGENMQPHNPIERVVIIVKENHTFDNYFGTFPGANGDATLAHASDPPPSDPPHDHAAWLRRATHAIKQQYQEADLPGYFALARQFTLCDNYFTDVASQSEPNHLMLIAGDSPIIDNASAQRTFQPQPPYDLASLPASLEKAGLTWKTYGDPGFSYFTHISALQGSPQIVSWALFDQDAAAGTLPSVSWVYAASEFSEHPPYGAAAKNAVVKPGMQWTVDRVNQVMQSKLWATTGVFITWDDWGGWFDHVDPLEKELWKGGGPAGYANSQFSYGPRVGCLVVSPFAKKGYISKAFHSHVSLVKFCETTFGLPALNSRVAAADDMSDCFDFQPAPPPAPAQVSKPANRGRTPARAHGVKKKRR